MAIGLDPKQVVSFEELLMSQRDSRGRRSKLSKFPLGKFTMPKEGGGEGNLNTLNNVPGSNDYLLP